MANHNRQRQVRGFSCADGGLFVLILARIGGARAGERGRDGIAGKGSNRNLLEVCPFCTDNLGTDMAGHFRDQHSQLLKLKQLLRRSGRTSHPPLLPSPATTPTTTTTYDYQ